MCHVVRLVCATALWQLSKVVRMVPAVIPFFLWFLWSFVMHHHKQCSKNVRDAASDRCGWLTKCWAEHWNSRDPSLAMSPFNIGQRAEGAFTRRLRFRLSFLPRKTIDLRNRCGSVCELLTAVCAGHNVVVCGCVSSKETCVVLHHQIRKKQAPTGHGRCTRIPRPAFRSQLGFPRDIHGI